MATSDSGEGGLFPTLFVGLAVLVVLAWFAMWVGAGLLAVWVLWQLVLRGRWREGFCTDLAAAALAAWAGGNVALGYTGWHLVAFGVAAVIAAIVAMVRLPESPDLRMPAMAVACAVGVASAFFGVVATQGAVPHTILVVVDDELGTAATLDDGFALARCLPDTAKVDASTAPALSYAAEPIQRVGSCAVSKASGALPVYFFLASDPVALDDWLSGGGLRGTARNADNVQVFRDGSVAVVSTDYMSAHILRDADLHSLELRS